jgi:hypothetical protein
MPPPLSSSRPPGGRGFWDEAHTPAHRGNATKVVWGKVMWGKVMWGKVMWGKVMWGKVVWGKVVWGME